MEMNRSSWYIPQFKSFFGFPLKNGALLVAGMLMAIQVLYIWYVDQRNYASFKEHEYFRDVYIGGGCLPSDAWLVKTYFDSILLVLTVFLIAGLLSDIDAPIYLFILFHLICYVHHVVNFVMFLTGCVFKDENSNKTLMWMERAGLNEIAALLVLWLIVNLYIFLVVKSYLALDEEDA